MSEMHVFWIRCPSGEVLKHIGTPETVAGHAAFLTGHFGELFSVVPPATPPAAPRIDSVSAAASGIRSRA
jgi:hypothetical protein